MRQAANGSDEQRQLTALFCDLVGSTELSANLDPEDYFEVVRVYHELAAGLVVRYGGHVAHYLGGGVVAYFGYPKAYDSRPAPVRELLRLHERHELGPPGRQLAPAPVVLQRCRRRGRKLAPHSRAL